MGVEAYRDRLRGDGWSVREQAVWARKGPVWQVTAARGDEVLYQEARDRTKAWGQLSRQARGASGSLPSVARTPSAT
jgi:hypothetical protein